MAFAVSWVLYKEERKEEAEQPQPAQEETPALECKPGVVYCPVEGTVIPMEQIPDETFAAGVLGDGCGVQPAVGRVVAPFDGEVTTVAESKHAIGLASPDGMELLIHVGINTVEMNGEGFVLHCAEGDQVKAGQLLLEFDIDRIKQGGYSTTTAVLVTNSEDLGPVTVEVGARSALAPILTVPTSVSAN